ncbi:MAG: Asp23/Gls24 family envelope stress response protein [Erysipelotrichaceae bacterium]|nr:Asp23/Gls24 family envelope stress response protein [Erysipelotrichaceae bacterium]
MAIKKQTNYGNINITADAIASLTGGIVTECYGVVGMASQKMVRDGLAELLKKENFSRGVNVRFDDDGIVVDAYIVVSFGVRISEVVSEIQKKVKYVLEKSLQVNVTSVNVFVQGVKAID